MKKDSKATIESRRMVKGQRTPVKPVLAKKATVKSAKAAVSKKAAAKKEEEEESEVKEVDMTEREEPSEEVNT